MGAASIYIQKLRFERASRVAEFNAQDIVTVSLLSYKLKGDPLVTFTLLLDDHGWGILRVLMLSGWDLNVTPNDGLVTTLPAWGDEIAQQIQDFEREVAGV